MGEPNKQTNRQKSTTFNSSNEHSHSRFIYSGRVSIFFMIRSIEQVEGINLGIFYSNEI